MPESCARLSCLLSVLWCSATACTTEAAMDLTIPVQVQVQVQDLVTGMAIDPLRQRIYIPTCKNDANGNPDPCTLRVIEEGTLTFSAQVDLDIHPTQISVDPVIDRVYVLGYRSSHGYYVSTVRGSTLTVLDTILLPAPVRFLSVDSATHQLHLGSNTVLDATTGMLTATLQAEAFLGEVLDRDRRRLYRAGAFPAIGLKSYDADTLAPLHDVSVGSNFQAIGIDKTANRIYLSTYYSWSHDIWVIDGDSLNILATIELPRTNEELGENVMAVDGQRHRIYHAAYDDDYGTGAQIAVIDGSSNQIGKTLPTSGNPAWISVSEATGRLYFITYGAGGGNLGSYHLTVFDDR